MNENSFVRPGAKAHAFAIATIQCNALNQALKSAGVPGKIDFDSVLAAWEDTFANPAPAGYGTLIAEEDGETVGYVTYLPIEDGIEIGDIQVQEARQRHGHGSRLLHAVADTNRSSSRAEVWLNAQDDASIRFFQGAGFAPAGKKRRLDVPSGKIEQHLWYTTLS